MSGMRKFAVKRQEMATQPPLSPSDAKAKIEEVYAKLERHSEETEVDGMTFQQISAAGNMSISERDGPMPAPDVVDKRFAELAVRQISCL